MKTRKNPFSFYALAGFVLILCLSVSCAQTDLVMPVAEHVELSPEGKLAYGPDPGIRQYLEFPEKISASSGDRSITPFAVYKLIDFRISAGEDDQGEHEMKEGGAIDPVPVHDAYDRNDEVTLSGEGQGWSGEFGRSVVSAHFRYKPKSMELKGEVTCTFSPSGEVVKFMLEGSGPLEIVEEFDGPHEAMILNISGTAGTGQYRTMVFEGTSCFLNAPALVNPEMEGFSSYLMTIGNYAE